MSSNKKHTYIFLGKVILITLLIVLVIRTFFIEPFTVSSSQMENTLYENDRILIDKTAYGIRLPMTILSIPFTFDNIGGIKSYSTLIELPYSRLFTKSIRQNDIILFNNSAETGKPLDKRELLLCRCTALPGEAIELKEGNLLINNITVKDTPYSINEYRTRYKNIDELKEIAKENDIPINGIRQLRDTTYLQLDGYNAFLLNEYLPDSLSLTAKADTTINYRFTIPAKGKVIELNEQNLAIYGQAILQEQEKQEAKIENGKLVIEGIEQNKYTFQDDYYWVISDNRANPMDSHTLGFIPFRSVIGKVLTVWHNPDEKLRDNRCFKQVK